MELLIFQIRFYNTSPMHFIIKNIVQVILWFVYSKVLKVQCSLHCLMAEHYEIREFKQILYIYKYKYKYLYLRAVIYYSLRLRFIIAHY